MAKTAALTISVAYSGDGIGAANTYSTTATNAAAPSGGPQLLVLTAGSQVLTAVTGVTLGALLVPPSASTNVKAIGATGSAGSWTNKPAFIPLQAAGTVTIYSTAGENVDLFWM